jgi:DNA-binding LacI/PurR family transcriptional regulator
MSLDGSIYNLYRSYNARTFASWQELQVTFVKQFYPEMGQQNALMVLSNIKQGIDEDIMFYV